MVKNEEPHSNRDSAVEINTPNIPATIRGTKYSGMTLKTCSVYVNSVIVELFVLPRTNKTVTKINQNHIAYKNVQDPRGEYAWLFGGMR